MTAVEGDRQAGAPIDDPVAPEATPAPPGPVTRRPHRLRQVAAAAALVLLGAVGGGVAGALTVLAARPVLPVPAPVVAAPADLADVVGAVAPAVLRVQSGAPDTGTAGTAVVLTPTGDVVTNEHLVHGETTATLIAPDGRSSVARVVAADPKADVAWLRIDGATDLPVAHLAGPGTVRLGEDVVAIGNALNLNGAPSITRGVVSAVDRSTATLDGVIQTDAAISSGSSGGALIDRTGAVVGITTEALVGDPSVSVEDIAFAVPSERVATVLGQMGLVLPPAR
jgi:putative serine protease PepD